MTAIIPESDVTMKNFLVQATEALAQGDLSLSYDCVQRYFAEMDEKKWETETILVLPIAFKILEQGDFQARWDIAKVLPKLGDRVIEPLIAVLDNPENDPEHRWFAARILGEFDQPSVILALVRLLQRTEDKDLKAIASQALGHIGKSAINALSKLLSNPQTRLLAVEALAQIPRGEVIELLLTVVHDPDGTIRTRAIAALGSFSDARILPILKNALTDLASVVRKEAIIALGFRAESLDQTDLLNQLQPLLYDLNLEVCQQAAIAISKLNSQDSARILSQVLQAPQTPIPLQLILIQSLAWQKTPASLAYLAQALTQISLEGALEIIRVLGRMDSLKPESAQILLTFFESKHNLLQQTQIRQAIAYSLGQLKVEKTLNALEILAQDAEPVVRLHAIAALKQFQTLSKN